jgi:hypothetical protein
MSRFSCPYLKGEVELTEERERHWIITAYLTRKLAEGEVEWRRN